MTRTSTLPQPLRSLQVVDTLSMGGAETWLMEVLRLWASEGSRAPAMDFLITSGSAGIFDDEARALGARLHYVPFGRQQVPAFVRSVQKILREGEYGAIHDHQASASGWHLLAGAGCLPAVRVVHAHNSLGQILATYGATPLRDAMTRASWSLAQRLATHITATSQHVLDSFELSSSPGAPVAAPLYCGFRSERFLGDPAAERGRLCAEFGWPTDSRVILFAGRIDRSADPDDPQAHKNATLAVRIGIACARQDPRVRVLFAGETSPAVPILEGQTASKGLADRFAFVGVRTDIERLMLGSHVLLFPSRVEGLGMVAVEAQAAGLPVVASTEVPSECAVLPDRVEFVSLSAPLTSWVEAVLRRVSEPRQGPEVSNEAVARSPFSVAYSACRLEQLYRYGSL